jgi:periplasmic protein TonB
MKISLLFSLLLFCQLACTQVVDPNLDTAILAMPEIDPEYSGGFEALIQYITTNLEGVSNPKKKRSVPKEDLFEGGRVIVRFIIEKDGSVSNVVLEERLRKCEPCNREAIRVVKNMPKWKPGSKNGKAVRTYVRLPINFVVD